MPVVDVGLYRWWVWVCADLSGCFFFFLRRRWWPSVFVLVVTVGDDDDNDSDRDREEEGIYYFNV